MSKNLNFINPETMPKPFGYSQIVEARGGRMVFIAGQVALNSEGQVVGEGDLEAQVRQTFVNLKAALEAVGLDFSHVVKLGIYVTDVSQLPLIRQVRNEFVNTQNPPASTLVQISALFRPEFLFEADAIAVAPD